MTDKTPTAAEAIEKLKKKDGEANNESARTNEVLAARDGGGEDPVEASLRANDPSRSRAAYTSHKSGFNEDLEPEEDTPTPKPKAKGQTKSVNR